jgi:hypothetical protein
MTTHRRRISAIAALVACTTVLVVGCGSDKKDDASSSGTSTTAASGQTTTSVDDGLARACTAYTTVTKAFSAEEPDLDAVKTGLDAMEKDKLPTVADEEGVMLTAARKVVASGGQDTSAFEAPDFTKAEAKVDRYVFDSCAFDAKVDVTAKDYEFDGIPKTLDAKDTVFLLTNDGKEAHEMAILRKKDGVTDSWDDILKKDQSEAEKLIDTVGSTFAPSHGATGLAFADLEPGDYEVVCFVSTGTTVDATGEHDGNGPPHFMNGMHAEFTVS